MKIHTSVAALFLMTSVSGASSANLLSNGDFEGVAPVPKYDDFQVGSFLNAWYSVGYTKSPTGSGDNFAKHATDGGGGDYRLIQFIPAATNSIGIGTKLRLEFDYIYNYDLLVNTNLPRNAYLIGIPTATTQYATYLGAGPDGDFGTSDNTFIPASMYVADRFELSRTESWIRDQVITATVNANYYAIGVVFQASCYDPSLGSTYCNYDRGFDNVSLTITGQPPSIPEPATLALLGLGLAGLGVTRRKKLAA